MGIKKWQPKSPSSSWAKQHTISICLCLHPLHFLFFFYLHPHFSTSVRLIWWADLTAWRGGEQRRAAPSYTPPLSRRCQGLQCWCGRGGETPGRLFPLMLCRVQRHFPRLPRWMVTNSRGRGLCERCTVYQADSSWQALCGGLKARLTVTQPHSQHKCTAADSLTAGECVYNEILLTGLEGCESLHTLLILSACVLAAAEYGAKCGYVWQWD